ncbi:MAG: PQQ-dependent sugar dehydrogenase [Burkholderiaceae bacterium]
MDFYDVLARVVAWVGAGAVKWRSLQEAGHRPAVGAQPQIPAGRPQGSIPTLKMPTARGWEPGQLPEAASGLQVNAFAAGLKHPRWILVLPNGDVTVAEALQSGGKPQTLFDHAMVATMRRAAAFGESPNRITLLRDADGDGVAEERHVLLENQKQPFGMALLGSTYYVGNTDGVMAFDYVVGATAISSPGRRLTTFKPDGHWTRSLLPSIDGRRLYVGVGSLTNIAEGGMAVEEGRACIYELDIETNQCRIFAGGLRNPVGMAWEPTTQRLWTVVNERDGLGDETPPDYLTSVTDGGFYGWPYCYWGKTVDDRVPQDTELVAKALTPDYALGGHTASLGLCWMPAGTLPGFDVDGMVIGQHGFWNRSKLSGYRVIFVPFDEGRPAGRRATSSGVFLLPTNRCLTGARSGWRSVRMGIPCWLPTMWAT